jgi:hypothetical protein
MAARQLLWEEQYGVHLRAKDRETRTREAQFIGQVDATRKYLQSQE